MRLEQYPQEQLKRELFEMLGRHLDMSRYRVFCFGSRVMPTGHDRSDIDIGVDGPGPIPVAAWLAIQEELERLPVLYPIEVVDFQRVSPTFRQVALQSSEPFGQAR